MKSIGLYDNNFLIIKKDTNLIKESIRRILLTSPGENLADLNFGSRVKSMIFNIDNYLYEDIENEITSVIAKYEPRVNISYLEIKNINDHKIEINLAVKSKKSLEEEEMTIGITL